MTVQKGNQSMTTSGDSSGQARREEGFPVGYYYLHPDVSVNYQMNRFSTGEADMMDEIRAVVPRIHDYNDYTREFLALTQDALGRGERALKDSLVTECGGPAGNPRNRRQNPGRVARPDAPVPHRRRVPADRAGCPAAGGGRRPLRSAAPVLRPDPPADRVFVHQARTGTRAHPDR